MSTDRQEYSIPSQQAEIATYAERRGYSVVRSYEDAGISGLSIEKRAGLQRLIADVIGGRADFEVILVYDVSRWGRFQNPDQAAHYEFMCAEAGVRVEYCAEPFENDDAPTSALLKHLKRAMAAEYSRDLSRKVALAARQRVAQGYWLGGAAPFGYRREVAGVVMANCPTGDAKLWRKNLGVPSTLVLAPSPEVDAVRSAFRLYLKGHSFVSVGRHLEKRGWRNAKGGPWSPARVNYLLQNEVYIGRLISGRRAREIGQDSGPMRPRSEWFINENAVPPIVSKRLFAAVQRERARRSRIPQSDEVLADLERLAKEFGAITHGILLKHGRWSTLLYLRRFGTIDEIREMLGLAPTDLQVRLRERMARANDGRLLAGQLYDDRELLEYLKPLLEEHGKLTNAIIDSAPGVPNSATYRSHFGSMTEVYRLMGYRPSRRQTASIKAARYCHESRRRAGWGQRPGLDSFQVEKTDLGGLPQPDRPPKSCG